MLNKSEQEQVLTCIAAAEKLTSGELRVHLEAQCKKEPMLRAIEVFNQLGMQKTAQRNGVLIYLAYKDRQFAIVGDTGINQRVANDFWDKVRDVMVAHFQKSQITEGLCAGLRLAGEKLAHYFPTLENDQNELPDQISFG